MSRYLKEMSMVIWWEIILRMLLAVVLGGVIGWERELSGKPAGLRTMILVSLSSAIFVLAAMQAAAAIGTSPDSVRAMAGIVSGVGFLGAGLVMHTQGDVRWLTTAASLWASAALGLSSALGMYMIALVGGVLVFVTLHWLPALERWVRSTRKTKAPPDPDHKTEP
jgi:putative Mg2+ transporter-C (MgtC) family protein